MGFVVFARMNSFLLLIFPLIQKKMAKPNYTV